SSGPYAVAIADVNGDGNADLVVAQYSLGANAVGVLLGNGDGTFQAPSNFATGASPYGLVVADLNGDGKPDVATANYRASNSSSSGGTVSVLLNTTAQGATTPTFQSPTNYAVGFRPVAVQALDVNADGRLDLAV